MPRTDVPAGLDLEAIWPADLLAKLPAVATAARTVLGAAVAFNRECISIIRDYHDRTGNVPGWLDLDGLGDFTGMEEVHEYLGLAIRVLEDTSIVSNPSDWWLVKVAAKHADIVGDVKRLERGHDPDGPFSWVGEA